MQIQPTSNYANVKNNKIQNQPNFKGMTDYMVKFWQFVDNGGRAMQFTVEDMTGTNIPRSIKGATAGYKYTGKINVPALLQEGIREFLTGPTMCVSPVAILAIATKMSGKTANTHVENIKNLSYLMNETIANTANKPQQVDELNKNFFDTVARDLLESTLNGESIDDADAFKEDVEKISDLLKAHKNEPDKKSAKKIVEQAQNEYENIIKKYKSNYEGVEFLKTTYSIGAGKKGTTKFKNYFEYVTSFADDFTKKFKNSNGDITISKKEIDAFKNNHIAKRLTIVACMLGITGLLMSFIPKIYTWASGGVNPNASAIYDEADKNSGNKRPSNEKKEVK